MYEPGWMLGYAASKTALTAGAEDAVSARVEVDKPSRRRCRWRLGIIALSLLASLSRFAERMRFDSVVVRQSNGVRNHGCRHAGRRTERCKCCRVHRRPTGVGIINRVSARSPGGAARSRPSQWVLVILRGDGSAPATATEGGASSRRVALWHRITAWLHVGAANRVEGSLMARVVVVRAAAWSCHGASSPAQVRSVATAPGYAPLPTS